jgi:cytochrome c
MKNIFLTFIVTSLLVACGGSDEKKTATTESTKEETPKDAPATPPANDISQNPDYKKGLSLIAKSDCLTCHKVDEPLTGPTYRDVANKYANMPDTIVSHLAGKIITGGKGVWGEISMTPHPALPKEDAEAMVRYILLLKK